MKNIISVKSAKPVRHRYFNARVSHSTSPANKYKIIANLINAPAAFSIALAAITAVLYLLLAAYPINTNIEIEKLKVMNYV